MKKQLIQRKVADKTRDAILNSARKHFAKNGFSGTSTQAIAKSAKTNEALIFHHFGNKSKLWQKVKASVVEGISLQPLHPNPKSFRFFLENAIQQRLNAYQKRSELMRLIQWQTLENKKNLIGGNKLAPTNWLVPLKHLQSIEQIHPDISLEAIIIWLTVSIDSIIFDAFGIFKDEKVKNQYINYLITGFESVFLIKNKY